jgi:hypothetical protein
MIEQTIAHGVLQVRAALAACGGCNTASVMHVCSPKQELCLATRMDCYQWYGGGDADGLFAECSDVRM